MAKFIVKRSYKDSHVAVRVSMRAGYHGDSARIDGATDISAAQARELATALTQEADRAEARAAAKKASEDRRQKWREREIAAGRLKVFGASELFQR